MTSDAGQARVSAVTFVSGPDEVLRVQLEESDRSRLMTVGLNKLPPGTLVRDTSSGKAFKVVTTDPCVLYLRPMT